MQKGTIFDISGQSYKWQKITNEGVYASKVLADGKCQRGRPSKFSHELVAKSLDIPLDTLMEPLHVKTAVKKRAPRPIEMAAEETAVQVLEGPSGGWGRPVQSTVKTEELGIEKEVIVKTKEELEAEKQEQIRRQEKIAELLGLIDDDSTVDDW